MPTFSNTTCSGSTATIVRVPYLNQLLATSDFLYITTDVAIWSTVEPGIGITCASLACCRPLIRNFLSRKLLWGNSSGSERKDIWPSTGTSYIGYRKNGNARLDTRDLGYGCKIEAGHNPTPAKITKTAHARHDNLDNADLELGVEEENTRSTKIRRSSSMQSLRNGTGWTMSHSRLADDSSEDYRSPPPPPRQDKIRIGVETTTDVSSAPARVVW